MNEEEHTCQGTNSLGLTHFVGTREGLGVVGPAVRGLSRDTFLPCA